MIRFLLAAFCLLPTAFCFAQGGQATALRRDPLTTERHAAGYASLAAAVAEANAAGGGIVTLDNVSHSIAADYTVPSTVTLRAPGMLNVADGKILTILGGIDNPGDAQIFGGLGTVKISHISIPLILPQWFGATNAIQKAIDSATGQATILISAGYSSTEAVSNPAGYAIIDLRRPNEVGIWSHLMPMRPVLNYPMGNDLRLTAHGPADVYVGQEAGAATTTSTTLIVGANNNVLVGSTADFASVGGMYLRIGRGTANEEVTTTFTIVDGTHFDITCANSHGRE